jgi:serine/threonine protein kinase
MKVTDTWNVKLCDMGLARFNTADRSQTMNRLCGTFAYVAPELYSGGSYTDKSDVFSASIVLWEIIIRVIKRKFSLSKFH